MKEQKTIHQNVKQIDLYQMVPCLYLYLLPSVHMQRKTSTFFIGTPDKMEGCSQTYCPEIIKYQKKTILIETFYFVAC